MKGHLYRRGAVPLAVLLVAVLCLAATLPAEADGRRAVDLASVKVFSSGIDLAPKVRYERAILTVSGMGRTFTQEFDSANPPVIGAFDPAGELLADGVYRWELQLVPDASTAKGMRASAGAGGVAQRPWLPKSGSFAIRGGAFATPNVRETDAGRNDEAAGRVRRNVDRPDRPDRQVAGSVFVADKASRGDAADTDEVSPRGASEAALKADHGDRRSSQRERIVRSTQTGFDSDHEAGQAGGSAEPALRMIPKAHEAQIPNPRPRSDGSNGRPRSDR